MDMLSSERYEEIKIIVANLFNQYKIKSFPISGFELAENMGISVIAYSSRENKELFLKFSEDGFSVERYTGEWYIFYNDDKNSKRVNNTIMHEIGHIVLDHTEECELSEKEVNFFAKYALVPPVLVYELGLDSANEIAKIFNVSKEASIYAYEYFKKWYDHLGESYKDYEYIILNLFKDKMEVIKMNLM